MKNSNVKPSNFGQLLFSAISIPAVATVALFSFATSASAAVYLIDIVIADEVFDFDTGSAQLSVETTGIDTVHLTGEVVTSGVGSLADVLLSWSFTMQDRNSVNTISSEGLLAGSQGQVSTGGLSSLMATETGLFATGGNWYFQEEIRITNDYYVGYVNSNLSNLIVQDIRQTFTTPPRTGAYAEQNDFFRFRDDGPALFGAIEDTDTISSVPLPASLPMMMAGLGLFGLVRRRKSRNTSS